MGIRFKAGAVPAAVYPVRLNRIVCSNDKATIISQNTEYNGKAFEWISQKTCLKIFIFVTSGVE